MDLGCQWLIIHSGVVSRNKLIKHKFWDTTILPGPSVLLGKPQWNVNEATCKLISRILISHRVVIKLLSGCGRLTPLDKPYGFLWSMFLQTLRRAKKHVQSLEKEPEAQVPEVWNKTCPEMHLTVDMAKKASASDPAHLPNARHALPSC